MGLHKAGILGTTLFVFAAALPLAGQTPSPPPPPPPPPPWRPSWTISGFIGGGSGGPAQSMVTHLERVGGFNAKSVCFYVGCPDYPRSLPLTSQWSVALGHTLSRRLGVRAVVSGGALGWAAGEGSGGSIAWHWSATTLGAQLTYDFPPAQWFKDAAFGATLGAGPVLAWVRSGRGVPDAYPADSNVEVTRVGLELRAAGTVWPNRQRHFFVGLEVGYRFLPGRTEGPYALDTGSGTLPSFDAAYHHLTIGMIAGVRFAFP